MTHIVYCPAVGYSLANDTGKRFALESAANHYALLLRRRGFSAWTEIEAPVGRAFHDRVL